MMHLDIEDTYISEIKKNVFGMHCIVINNDEANIILKELIDNYDCFSGKLMTIPKMIPYTSIDDYITNNFKTKYDMIAYAHAHMDIQRDMKFLDYEKEILKIHNGIKIRDTLYISLV